MGKPWQRQANFELLRIIAMFMVVILHWNTNSGLLLAVGSPVTGAGVWSLVTESVCIVAVNVYVLISGVFPFPPVPFPSGVWRRCWFRRCFIRC